MFLFLELQKRLFGIHNIGPLDNLKLIYDMGINLTRSTFENKKVQNLLNSGETFDLVLMEHFLNDAEVGIAYHFKAPIVLVSPFGIGRMNHHLFASPLPSSYVPNVLGTLPKHMSFLERLKNFYLNVLTDVVRELYNMPRQRELFKKFIKSDLELDDLLYNVSLLLTNSHISVNDPVPRVPGIVEIGGFHVNPPKKLPEDLQKFLDDAKEGVILFSMGSNLKSKDLKPETRDGILKAFSKINQKVLWKFETELPNAPKNVKVMKWLPQQDILGSFSPN